MANILRTHPSSRGRNELVLVAAAACAVGALVSVVPAGSIETWWFAVSFCAVLYTSVMCVRQKSTAFVLFALAFVAWLVGDVLARGSSRPLFLEFTGSDAAYLLGYPYLIAGMALLAREKGAGHDRAGLIDGTITSLSVCIVTWAVVLAPEVLHNPAEAVTRGVMLLYVAGDLLLLALALRTTGLSKRRSTGQRALLAAPVCLFVYDTLALVLYASGRDEWYFSRSLWWAAIALLGVAARDPRSMAALDRRTRVFTLSKARGATLTLALLVIPFIELAHALVDHDWVMMLPVVLTLMAISVLVLMRLHGLVHALEDSREKLAYEALHDPLTGLANRTLLREHLAKHPSVPAVVVIDLDGFKPVNDEHGHHVGDIVLQEVSRRFESVVRDGDLVVRLGGDEFAVVAAGLDIFGLAALGERLLTVVSQPVEIPGGEVRIGASIGIATDTDEDVDSVFRAADVAMYAAKKSGKGRVVFASTPIDYWFEDESPANA